MKKKKLIKLAKNVVAVIVTLALLVIIFYQNRDRDIFKFGQSESSRVVASNPEETTSSSLAKSDAQMLGDEVAFLSPSAFSVLNKKAEGESAVVAYTEPVLHTDGDYAVIYDENSKSATVYKNSRLSYNISTEEEIIKAKVNPNGYLLVTTKKEGYNCESVAYNKNGEAIFKWDISKSEFLDGVINYSNNKVVISLATSDENKLYGELLVLDIKTAKELKRHRYESQLFYELHSYKNDTYAAFGSGLLVYINSDGGQKWKYDYTKRSLVNADITNPDMMVLAFLPEGTIVQGGATDVKVINRIGVEIAEKTFDGSIEDISVTDEAIAIAYGKKVVIANSKLKEKELLESDSGIKKITMFSDSKHVLAIGNSEVRILK